ncbi:37S ribosomal protein S22, partial [Ceratobasidium sp. 394]
MSFRSTLALLRNATAHVSHAPNAPLELDPALSRLLHDTNLSLLRKFRHGSKHYVERAELEVGSGPNAFENPPPEFGGYGVVERESIERNGEDEGIWDGPRDERRSPAAIYGAKHIGMVVLPWELEHAVEKVVGESDKHQLRSDAKRLFYYPSSPSTQPASSSSSPSKAPRNPLESRTSNRPPEWQLSSPNAASLSFSTKGNYKTAVHLGSREGLAFATVAMPAHYAATANVFREIAQRMDGPGQGEDRIETVVDFGGKSGQGLWASLVAFREPIPPPEPTPTPSPTSSGENANPESWTPISASPHHPRVGPSSTPPSYAPPTPSSVLESLESETLEHTIAGKEAWTASTIKKYMLLDSRRGMTELARRFVKDTDLGGCEILYQDFWGK